MRERRADVIKPRRERREGGEEEGERILMLSKGREEEMLGHLKMPVEREERRKRGERDEGMDEGREERGEGK